MKKLLKTFSFIFISILFLLPKNVFAATHYLYSVSTNSYSTLDAVNSYNIGLNNPHLFDKTYFHKILDGNTSVLAYCLDDGFTSPDATEGSIYNADSTAICDKAGRQLDAWQVKLLKNIMAAGYQYSGDVSGLVNASNTVKKNIIATQVLVWEVMDGVRSDYTPSNLASPSPTTYDFVKTDSEVKQIYERILSDASKLAGNSKPSSFGQTYILHWNDGSSKYTSSSINISFYSVDTYDNKLSVSNKDSSNNIVITSKSEISSPATVNFKFISGSTLNSNNELRWFRFGSSTSTTQNLILAYYKGSVTGSLNVKTESGKFRITKMDSTTKKSLKGAVFKMYKCASQSNCESSPTSTIDLTNKAISDEITLKKSGLYLIKETTVPSGYEKINDFYVRFSIADDGKVTATIDSSVKNVKQVPASGSTVLNITIYNEAKYFNIKKIDGRNDSTQINGATFRIKKSDGTVMKFIKEEEGKYRYDETGSVTDLVSANKSIYQVSLLPNGNYVLEETAVPYPYVLPSKQLERETAFKIDDANYLQVYNYKSDVYVKSTNVTITAKNFKTRVTILKTGLKQVPVGRVTFELYDSNKANQIPLRLENGEYIYNRGGTPIQIVTDSNGKAIINYLPEGKYYLKETTTPDESGLSVDPDNQWTEIEIFVNRDSATAYDYRKEIRNAKGSFCFYKIDEDGNYLDTGTFILQMYNTKTGRYDDKPLIFNEEDSTYTIDLNNDSDIYTFSPIYNGQTCFKDVNVKGKYRVVEIEAPEGFVLPKVSETRAELVINEYGYAVGDAVIINKQVTVGEGAEASAELIINIQTGQNRIHYIIIISVVLAAIIGLLILKKKIDKK